MRSTRSTGLGGLQGVQTVCLMIQGSENIVHPICEAYVRYIFSSPAIHCSLVATSQLVATIVATIENKLEADNVESGLCPFTGIISYKIKLKSIGIQSHLLFGTYSPLSTEAIVTYALGDKYFHRTSCHISS